MSRKTILKIENLVTRFNTEEGIVRAVDDVSFPVKKGETLGIVGESGCGKSVTALSIMRLLPKPAGEIEKGRILFMGEDLTRLSSDHMAKIRGNRIAMIFQEPMTALNPVHRIEKQLAEVFHLHFPRMNDVEVFRACFELLHKVGIPEPDLRMKDYPHQISGGMRQRVMIAMALACNPDILIADEPTTALDVTIQAQILDLIARLQKETGMSVIFITHDLGVIAEICDRVVVMYAGKVVEQAKVAVLFKNPAHPYTMGLLNSIPGLENTGKTRLNIIPGMVPGLNDLPKGCRFKNRCSYAKDICDNEPPLKKIGRDHIAYCHFAGNFAKADKITIKTPEQRGFAEKPETGESETKKQKAKKQKAKKQKAKKEKTSLCVENLKMHFPIRGGVFMRKTGLVYAVDGVSLKIPKGKTLGLVGESGCGKTTLGRCILRLYEPTSGKISFEGTDILKLRGHDLRKIRKNIQMIFQDPFESLNSRHTIGDIIEEPFIIHKIAAPGKRLEKVTELLKKVGISKDAQNRFPHEFSGGQRQRIGIARAIALEPRLIICDEPVSALDVSIQSQILNLLMDLQNDMGLTYLFISHDLTVVKHISDYVAVMYLGKIVEYTDANTIYSAPLHPYTKALLSAIPVPDPSQKKKKTILTGDVPSPVNPPSGCRFRTRCPVKMEKCIHEEPLLLPAGKNADKIHLVACHRKDI